jgi:hypothetical protein
MVSSIQSSNIDKSRLMMCSSLSANVAFVLSCGTKTWVNFGLARVVTYGRFSGLKNSFCVISGADLNLKKVPFKICFQKTNYWHKTSSTIFKVCMFRCMTFDWKVQRDVNLCYKSRFQLNNIYSCPGKMKKIGYTSSDTFKMLD